MTIEFECPDCSREYRVKDELAGRGVTCKDCGTKIHVPDPYAEDDEWDDYDEEAAYDEEPTPVRRRSKRKKSPSGSKKKAASSSGALWKKIMGPLAMLLGVVIAGFSVMSLMGGNGRAARGLITGIVFTGVGFKWLRDE